MSFFDKTNINLDLAWDKLSSVIN